MNAFQPTKSKEFFLGRGRELDLFEQILQGKQVEWIVHVPGPGGVGKTCLLEKMRDEALQRQKMLVTADLVDFYKPANQAGFGLLHDMARQLGLQHFPTFEKERQWFQQFLQTEPEPGERQDAANRVTEAFLRDYRRLLDQGFRVVLLLDTCEEMHAVEGWVLNVLLPRIGQQEEELWDAAVECGRVEKTALKPYQTTVVLAGRKELSFPPELEDRVLRMELPPLTREEVKEFFRSDGLGNEVVSDAALTQLYELTGGRPLYVALSYDWLKNEVGTVEELLDMRQFPQELVRWILRLKTREARAILYTALAWRRVEPSLLSQLLECEEAEAQGIIAGLSRFSFVKYRAASEGFAGSFQLHDEMRNLVLHYVWPEEGQLTRNALLAQIAAWYEQRIGNAELLAGQKLPPDDEAKSLLAEWLFYRCQLSLEEGATDHERLFRNASHYLDLAFCELINEELRRFKDKLSPQQLDDLGFREALTAFRRERYDRAKTIWYSLLRRPDLHEKVRATSLMLLVELEAYTGHPAEAIVHAQQAEDIYERLIAQEVDDEKGRLLQGELGQLYNNWGYACRVMGQWPEAREYYNKALQLPGRPKNVARTLNNIGYLYFLLGDLMQARTYIGRALQMRRELGIAYELGLGYNTMGIVMEQNGRLDAAADLYHKARLAFEAVPSERGQALVFLNLGRLNRVINDFDEALQYLEWARRVFDGKRDKDQLVGVLNELGCVYRQRGEHDDWEKAEGLLRQSLALSQELGHMLAQADNWDDLSVLYYRLAGQAYRQGDAQAAKTHARHAREAAREASRLAQLHRYTYLVAKAERIFGDLAYEEREYDVAFGHYLQACRSMARARAEGGRSEVLLQRMYEEMVDRLQEQLQNLPDSHDTQQQAERLMTEVAGMEQEEKERLKPVTESLHATIRMAQRTRNIAT